MAYQISDKTGDIVTGSIYLPRSKAVPIGKPLVGAAIAVLKQELLDVYGDRFKVTEEKAAEPEFVAVVDEPEAKPTRRKTSTEKPAE